MPWTCVQPDLRSALHLPPDFKDEELHKRQESSNGCIACHGRLNHAVGVAGLGAKAEHFCSQTSDRNPLATCVPDPGLKSALHSPPDPKDEELHKHQEGSHGCVAGDGKLGHVVRGAGMGCLAHSALQQVSAQPACICHLVSVHWKRCACPRYHSAAFHIVYVEVPCASGTRLRIYVLGEKGSQQGKKGLAGSIRPCLAFPPFLK